MHYSHIDCCGFDFRVVKRLLLISQVACSNLSSALTRSISAMAFFSISSPRRMLEKASRPQLTGPLPEVPGINIVVWQEYLPAMANRFEVRFIQTLCAGPLLSTFRDGHPGSSAAS